jgi:uncharacterized protein (DUF2235 family)
MSKNIVLCFDGTWNKPSESKVPEESTDTNVFRFYQSLRDTTLDGKLQVKWYDAGVGTEWMNKVRGGAFGLGLDKHIIDGYLELCRQYEPEDKVFIVGFSRGAYTARSVVGLIRNAGVLCKDDQQAPIKDPQTGKVDVEKLTLVGDEAYDLYRTRDQGPDSETARTFRAKHSHEIEIDFVGVWDTVGALGVPLKSFSQFNSAKYTFHDTKLSKIVRNAFHALALDEHRKPYVPTLWGPQAADDKRQRIEQAWFPGAHADVGGGYAKQPLSNIPLRWMQRRAEECGLALEIIPTPTEEDAMKREYLADTHDSFSEFLHGAYAMLEERFFRPVGRDDDGIQTLHSALTRRLKLLPSYKPLNNGLSRALMSKQISDD